MDPIIYVVIAGALGGLLRSIFGYAGEAENTESFDPVKAGKSILRAIIGGGLIGYALFLSGVVPVGMSLAAVAFFSGMAADVSSKNIWEFIQPYLKK